MDYLPSGESDFILWSRNFNTEIAIAGPQLNMPTTDTAALQKELQDMIERVNEANTAAQNLKKANSGKSEAKKSVRTSVRNYVKQLKANPLYTDEIGKNLGIVNLSPTIDLINYKPALKAKVSGGFVQISFVKKGVHGINIYTKLPGANVFTLLGTAIQSPYIDTRPPAIQGVNELRQYNAMGIEKNTEVGQRSEVESVSYSG